MQSVKAFVEADATTTIACPACNRSKKVSVAGYKHKKHNLQIRCACHTLFFAHLEFRRHKRRAANLKGNYTTYHQYIHREGKMLISNISRGGLLCQLTNYRGLTAGNILTLEYVLNDIGQRKISKRAIIRHTQGRAVGCEFLELRQPETRGFLSD
jgi:hypothetical protein